MSRFLRLLLTTTALLAVALLAGGSAFASASAPPHNSPGPVLWTAPASVDTAPIDAMACPSTTLCVAVGRAGRALWSVNPAGGARAWQSATVDGGRELTSIACPSVSLCVAVDGSGNAVTTTDPTGGPAAWTAAAIDQSATQSNSDTAGPILLRGVSCPSTTECLAIDADGNTLVSSNPTGGATAWTINHADANRSFGCTGPGLTCQPPLIGIACPSVSLCSAVDFSGNILTTQEPTGAGPWPSVPTDPGRLSSLWGVSCPQTTFCATVDGDANRAITFNPTTPDVQAAHREPDGLYGIWCQSASLCLASAQTSSGLSALLGSSDPAATRPTWSQSSPGAVTGIACPSAAVCVAADGQGDVLAGVTIQAAGTLLHNELLPTRRLPTIAAIDRLRRLTFVVASPIAARVSLTWRAPGSAILVGTVTHRFTAAGTARLTLPLTPLGLRLFRAATSRVTVRATATFLASSGSLTVSGNRTFLHPPRAGKPARPRRAKHR